MGNLNIVYIFEIDQSVLLNVIMTLSSIVYVLLVFRGTVIKRLMATKTLRLLKFEYKRNSNCAYSRWL